MVNLDASADGADENVVEVHGIHLIHLRTIERSVDEGTSRQRRVSTTLRPSDKRQDARATARVIRE